MELFQAKAGRVSGTLHGHEVRVWARDGAIGRGDFHCRMYSLGENLRVLIYCQPPPRAL